MVHSISKGISCVLSIVILATALAFVGLPARATERLPLGPGDVVSIIYSGIGTIIPEVPVDEAGKLELQWLGTYDATGRTSTEVQAEVKTKADGKVFRHFNEAGIMELLPVSSADIWLRVEQRRGITVYGNVMASGEFPYRSNLTARAVIGLAGGVRTPLAVRDQALSPLQIFDLQGRYVEAVHERAALTLRLWGIQKRLSPDAANPLPDRAGLGISDAVYQRLISDQEEHTKTYLDAGRNEHSFLQRALAQARARVEILREQSGKQYEILAAEEEEEERVKDLVERKLVPAQRLAETRRNTLLTSARLLNIEEDLSQAELDVTRRAREIETLKETRDILLLEERERVLSQLIDAEARSRRLGEGLNPFGSQTGGQSGANAPLIIIYRRNGAEVEAIEAKLDAYVLPGDIVEVIFKSDSLPGMQ